MTKTIRLATKQVPGKGIWDKQTWEQFQVEKEKILADVFKEADRLDLSDDKLAELAGVSSSTVYNLVHYNTLNPQLSTVWKLARAVGFELGMRVKRSKRKIA